jgi:hypothetical protein
VIYPFDRTKLERILGGPVPPQIEKLFGELRKKAERVGGASQPDPWVYALCLLMSEALHPDDGESPVQVVDPEPENLVVRFQVGTDVNDIREGKFVRRTDKGNYQVRVDGEERIRTVSKSKVLMNG